MRSRACCHFSAAVSPTVSVASLTLVRTFSQLLRSVPGSSVLESAARVRVDA